MTPREIWRALTTERDSTGNCGLDYLLGGMAVGVALAGLVVRVMLA